MSTTIPGTAQSVGRADVSEMILAGDPLAEVERAIESSGLDEEGRASLWLLAWALSERRR